jgi:hypothetical protein
MAVIPSEARNRDRPDRGPEPPIGKPAIPDPPADAGTRARNDGWIALAVAIVLVLAACDGQSAVRTAQASPADSTRRVEAARSRQDSIVRSRPGYIVDSILPVQEEIRRFQATIPTRPTSLAYGASSRAALVAAFVRALEDNDTTALAQLVVDRAEFGHLIYPTSPNAAPPYRQPPELVWMSRAAMTDKALARLLERFGGKPLGYIGFTCRDSADREGENRLWSGCVVSRLTPTGGTTRLRMFGAIIERAGRFKFLSLANGL